MNRMKYFFGVLLLTGLTACNLLTSETASPTLPVGNTLVIPSVDPNQGQHNLTPTVPTPVLPSITPSLTPTLSPTPYVGLPRLAAGTNLDMVDIHMVDANSGWGIGRPAGSGNAQNILRTSDGGSTWKDVTPPQPADSSSTIGSALGYFADSFNAWVTYSAGQPLTVPSAPVVWRTTDGGQTWQASAPLDTTGLNEVYSAGMLTFADAQHGWLLVHVGAGMMHDYIVLYSTANGGASWSKIVDPTNNDAGIQSCVKTGLLFRDGSNGWLTGNCNGVQAGAMFFHSADGGTSWQNVNLPAPADHPDMLTSMDYYCQAQSPFAVAGGNLFLEVQCKSSGATLEYLYFTSDNGGSWTSRSYPGGHLFFLDNDHGWALGPDIQRTVDTGAHWTKLSHVDWQGAFDFVSGSQGWAVATNPDTGEIALVKTTDGGIRWAVVKAVIGS